MTAFRVNPARLYGRRFVESELQGALRSARAIVPIVMDMLRPVSVLDVGCGNGAWLRAFQECGVSRVLGIDGGYVDRSMLMIDARHFRSVDLSLPFDISDRYDLVLCLEVAEHLPPENSALLVRALTAAAPAVLFSAAIPGQGGTGHIDEQWPSYWCKLFGDHGYRATDSIRRSILFNREIEWWYRQNLLLFASEEAAATNQSLKLALEDDSGSEFEWVHVEILHDAQNPRFAIRQKVQALQRRALRLFAAVGRR